MQKFVSVLDNFQLREIIFDTETKDIYNLEKEMTFDFEKITGKKLDSEQIQNIIIV